MKSNINEKNGMDDQKVIEELLLLFPEHKSVFEYHMREFGELLNHVFYSKVIGDPLFDLLQSNKDTEKIKKYVRFIEHMWKEGNESVKNVINVTILEHLSDNKDVWHHLGTYISEEFREHINNELLVYNIAMQHVKAI